MNILFVIQGEGRGHMTQAIALADMLRRNGHRVVEALVGCSEMRQAPGFFHEQIQAPVQAFASPNFLKTPDNKHFRIYRSIAYNLRWKCRKAYFSSIRFIARRIDEMQPDLVVNFYEMLVGLACWRYKISVPVICVAHQFMFIHPAFVFSRRLTFTHRLLRLYTRICRLRASKCLALSYAQIPDVPREKLFVAPPLLRSDVLNLQSQTQPFLLGYILNHGFADEITQWHARHTETEVHVFWDKPDAPGTYTVHPNLTYHRLNYQLFTKMLGNCSAFFGTAGIEAVCEALYLGKPILVVPAHGEQQLNADYAAHAGVITAESFDLNPLLEKISKPVHNNKFKEWADKSEEMIMKLLELQNENEKSGHLYCH
ncbi:MAG: glycosyltransferase [Bacteroidales bacterium]|jgi:uncharacterized protein (TIGR00661 family)|nr:glycosyltransferase [Bacteroidales bacterium]